MRQILWVEGSPKAEHSLSTACALAFLEGVNLRSKHISFERLNVWEEDLPEFSKEAALAKFAPILGEKRTNSQEAIWSCVEERIEHLESFDSLLISSPMWNWSIPYRLKQWIDIVAQPFRTFTLSDEGRHVGVVGVGKSAQLILTRSSAYDGRSPEMSDHQRPYLEYLFGNMLGYSLEPTLVLEPTTVTTHEERKAVHSKAIEAATAAGESFA